MTPLYNGMLPPSLVGRLADIWPGGKHVVTEYGEKYAGPPPQVVRITIGNATPADLEAYCVSTPPRLKRSQPPASGIGTSDLGAELSRGTV
jgi:hypothetical protein